MISNMIVGVPHGFGELTLAVNGNVYKGGKFMIAEANHCFGYVFHLIFYLMYVYLQKLRKGKCMGMVKCFTVTVIDIRVNFRMANQTVQGQCFSLQERWNTGVVSSRRTF